MVCCFGFFESRNREREKERILTKNAAAKPFYELKKIILTALKNYIQSRTKTHSKELSFTSIYFRNRELTVKKIKLVRECREKIAVADSVLKMKELLSEYKKQSLELEASNPQQLFFTESKLCKIFSGLENIAHQVKYNITTPRTPRSPKSYGTLQKKKINTPTRKHFA